MPHSILGKVAVVSGAARGIGLAITRHFAHAGAEVVLADLDEDGVHTAAREIRDDGVHAIGFGDDVGLTADARIMSKNGGGPWSTSPVAKRRAPTAACSPMTPSWGSVEDLTRFPALEYLRDDH